MCTTVEKEKEKKKSLSFPNKSASFQCVWAYANKLQTKNIEVTYSPFLTHYVTIIDFWSTLQLLIVKTS